MKVAVVFALFMFTPADLENPMEFMITDVLEKFQKEIEVSKNAKVLKGYGQMYKKAMTKAKSDGAAVYQHTKTMYEDKIKELNGKESNV